MNGTYFIIQLWQITLTNIPPNFPSSMHWKSVVISGILISMMFANTSNVSAYQDTESNGCDVVIGIDDSGLAFDKTDVKIEVGETVCWIWENESMEHNVAQVDSENSDESTSDGIYSGEPAKTVDFRHTFTEDVTFHYVCEPHVSMDMRGTITVGEGTPEKIGKIDRPAPGFEIAIGLMALLGATLVRNRAEHS